MNDTATVLGLTLGVVGFLLGSGSLNYPFVKLSVASPSLLFPRRVGSAI